MRVGKPKQNPDGTWSQDFEHNLEIPVLDKGVRPKVENMRDIQFGPDDDTQTPVYDWTEDMVDDEVSRVAALPPDERAKEIRELLVTLLAIARDAQSLAVFAIDADDALQRLPKQLKALEGAKLTKLRPIGGDQ